MYDEKEISNEFYNYYYDLVGVLKNHKNSASTKLTETIKILNFFANYKANIEEAKIIKNVLIIANSLIEASKVNKKNYAVLERKECEELVKKIKNC